MIDERKLAGRIYLIRDIQHHEAVLRDLGEQDFDDDERHILVKFHVTAKAYLEAGAAYDLDGPAAEYVLGGKRFMKAIDDELTLVFDGGEPDFAFTFRK